MTSCEHYRASGTIRRAHMGVLLLIAAIIFTLPFPVRAAQRDEPIVPLPQSLNTNAERAKIGKLLFQDTRLSANAKVSCASCHDISKNGADTRARSLGFRGQATAVNAPTVFNAALNFAQFWNGRAHSLEAQVDAVVQNPIEMGSRWSDVVAMIGRDDAYRKSFATAYPDGISKANVQNAIASYERTLITPNSLFDRYLSGEVNAINQQEKAGYFKFKQYGCIACHQGVNVGGNMFQKFGVMADYFALRGNPTQADLGRYLVTGEEDDKHVFKVPSLRNVALTAPYFHDASAPTLDAAVDIMFRYQLGRVPSQEDRSQIVAFLRTLTGKTGTHP